MKHKRWIIVLIALGLVLAGSAFALLAGTAARGSSPSDAPAAGSAPSFQEVTLNLGTITKNVIATGSLRYERQESLTVPDAVTIKSLEVAVGDRIEEGQLLATFDTRVIEEEIQQLEEALSQQEAAIIQLLGQQKAEQLIQPEVAGVVKALNLEAGQMVQSSLAGEPAAVISTNGLMQVAFTPSQEVSLGQSLRVKISAYTTQTGSVARVLEDGSVLVTFPDSQAALGQEVQVLLGNVEIGTGTAQISLPYLLYTQVDGVVDSVPVKTNAKVTKNTTLFKVVNAGLSTEYTDALAEKEELVDQIAYLKLLLAKPQLQSSGAGIVSELVAQPGASLQEGATLLKYYPSQAFVLDVSVDELDILSVQVGQEGWAKLDALSDNMMRVVVTKISPLGTTQSGITNYTVSLAVQEDERLMSGMNGTATLTVGQAADSVLLPLAALMNDRQGSYVLKKGADESEANGVKTYVELGLSDASHVAVIAGLQAGDVVLVRPSAMEGTRQNQFNFGQGTSLGRQQMPGGGSFPGGQFPGGGGRP